MEMHFYRETKFPIKGHGVRRHSQLTLLEGSLCAKNKMSAAHSLGLSPFSQLPCDGGEYPDFTDGES